MGACIILIRPRPIAAVLCAGLLASLATPAGAASWHAEQMRGVETQVISEGDVQLRLICDPDRVYGADTSALFITSAGQPVEGEIVVVFNGADRKTITLHTTDTAALRSSMPADDWKALVDGLSSGAEFAVVTPKIKPIFRPKAGFEVRCY